MVPVMPLSQRWKEEVDVTEKEREEDIEIDAIDLSFYSCFFFFSFFLVEHLLFEKVVCVAARYFKEGNIQCVLSLTCS